MLQNEFVANYCNLTRVRSPGQFSRVMNVSAARVSGSFSVIHKVNDDLEWRLYRTERGVHSDIKFVPGLQSNQKEPKHVDADTNLYLSVSHARSFLLLFPFKLHISSSFLPGQYEFEFHVAEWEPLST